MMIILQKIRSGIAVLMVLAFVLPANAYLHDGRQFAIEAGLEQLDLENDPYLLREQWWDGTITSGERQVIRMQLFAGNEYWFWVGLSQESKEVEIHIYDENGQLVEEEAFVEDNRAGSRVQPESTGVYFIVMTAAENNGNDPADWAVVYAYR